MTEFLKALMLANIFNDDHSKWMIIYEWLRNDPILQVRWEMAKLSEDI